MLVSHGPNAIYLYKQFFCQWSFHLRVASLFLFFILFSFCVCVLSAKLHINIGEGLLIFGSYYQDRTLHYFLLYYLVNININMDWVGLVT